LGWISRAIEQTGQNLPFLKGISEKVEIETPFNVFYSDMQDAATVLLMSCHHGILSGKS